ncbi:hypothetical protein P9228_17080 [Mesorhizobium sp. WSM4898]|uniref:hypothetical protein n=1 Tax=Mesorhizobium sp. WSM4898 TaxID=3038544 RepID=UPI002414D14A|nr:hypothetical protein [Mesorhizobium sp. WSM4898]MDG4908144.1 hypothetical protein [Mesorhizobium sp. WSM4898]
MPNTIVPAAGEAMPAAEGMQIITGRFSRRAMLVGAIASIPTIAGAVAAPAISNAADVHPDAELFRLDAEMDALQARSDQIGRDLAQIEEMAEEAAGPRPINPSDWKCASQPDDIREMKAAWLDKARHLSVEEGRALCPVRVREWLDAWQDERDRVQAAWDSYSKRRFAHAQRLGLSAKEEEDDACAADEWEIGQRILATPASTLAGIAVKLRTSDRLGLDDFPKNEALASISADIRRMVEGGAA